MKQNCIALCAFGRNNPQLIQFDSRTILAENLEVLQHPITTSMWINLETTYQLSVYVSYDLNVICEALVSVRLYKTVQSAQPLDLH